MSVWSYRTPPDPWFCKIQIIEVARSQLLFCWHQISCHSQSTHHVLNHWWHICSCCLCLILFLPSFIAFCLRAASCQLSYSSFIRGQLLQKLWHCYHKISHTIIIIVIEFCNKILILSNEKQFKSKDLAQFIKLSTNLQINA